MANVKRSTLTKSQLVNQAVVNKLITPRHMQTSGENAYKARIPSQYELYPIVKDSMSVSKMLIRFSISCPIYNKSLK